MAADPRARYPEGAALAADLEAFLRGEAPLGAPRHAPPLRWALLALGAVGIGLWALRPGQAPAPAKATPAARPSSEPTADPLAELLARRPTSRGLERAAWYGELWAARAEIAGSTRRAAEQLRAAAELLQREPLYADPELPAREVAYTLQASELVVLAPEGLHLGQPGALRPLPAPFPLAPATLSGGPRTRFLVAPGQPWRELGPELTPYAEVPRNAKGAALRVSTGPRGVLTSWRANRPRVRVVVFRNRKRLFGQDVRSLLPISQLPPPGAAWGGERRIVFHDGAGFALLDGQEGWKLRRLYSPPAVRHFAVFPSGRLFASLQVGGNEEVALDEATPEAERLRRLPDPDREPLPATEFVLRSDPTRLYAVAGQGGRGWLSVWEEPPGEGWRLVRRVATDYPLSDLALSPDGAWIAVAGARGFEVWAAGTAADFGE